MAKFTIDDIARVIHEANRAIQQIQGDPNPSTDWDHETDHVRTSCREGVHDALAGASPEESHDAWREHLAAQGWKYGPVKDEQAKTHPCMVPFDELDMYQRAKSLIFVAIVGAIVEAQRGEPNGNGDR